MVIWLDKTNKIREVIFLISEWEYLRAGYTPHSLHANSMLQHIFVIM